MTTAQFKANEILERQNSICVTDLPSRILSLENKYGNAAIVKYAHGEITLQSYIWDKIIINTFSKKLYVVRNEGELGTAGRATPHHIEKFRKEFVTSEYEDVSAPLKFGSSIKELEDYIKSADYVRRYYKNLPYLICDYLTVKSTAKHYCMMRQVDVFTDELKANGYSNNDNIHLVIESDGSLVFTFPNSEFIDHAKFYQYTLSRFDPKEVAYRLSQVKEAFNDLVLAAHQAEAVVQKQYEMVSKIVKQVIPTVTTLHDDDGILIYNLHKEDEGWKGPAEGFWFPLNGSLSELKNKCLSFKEAHV